MVQSGRGRDLLSGAERGRYSGGSSLNPGENSNVGSNGFAAGLRPASGSPSRCCCGWPAPAAARWSAARPRSGISRSGKPNWPARATQIGNCYSNQFELPLLFYVLIALALPLRHADLVIVLLSWVFVVTRFAHAGIFVSSNDLRQRSLAWFAGVLVLFAMWIYFALKILLLI